MRKIPGSPHVYVLHSGEPGNEAIVILNCTSPVPMLHSLGMGLEVVTHIHIGVSVTYASCGTGSVAHLACSEQCLDVVRVLFEDSLT